MSIIKNNNNKERQVLPKMSFLYTEIWNLLVRKYEKKIFAAIATFMLQVILSELFYKIKIYFLKIHATEVVSDIWSVLSK